MKEIVAFFLDRTRGVPFSFAFCKKRGYPEKDYYIRPILKDLLVHSEQWDEVSIELLSTDLKLLCAAKGHLPLLKKLEIMVPYQHTDSSVPSTVANVFEDAPLLTHVVLRVISAWRFKFNWSPLTILDFQQLNNGNFENMCSLLREAINLVELTLCNTCTHRPHIEGSELIHLPRLECLSIMIRHF